MTKRVVTIPTGCLVAVPLLLVGLFVVGMGAALALQPAKNPIPDSAVEGVVEGPNEARAPIGEPFVYGFYKCVAVLAGMPKPAPLAVQQKYIHALQEGELGSPVVTVRTASGPVRVRVGDPWRRWIHAEPLRQEVPSLASFPPPFRPEGWDRLGAVDHYGLDLMAIRAGDTVAVEVVPDGEIPRVWFGGRARYAEDAAAGKNVRLVLAGGIALAGLFMLVAGGAAAFFWR
ncbi:MAG: hypothetical protein ACOZNI_22945 [Myxococcota bacterium]